MADKILRSMHCPFHFIWCFLGNVRTRRQISTINLVFMGAGAYMSENATILNIAIFTVSFTIFRMVICPKLWWEIFIATWEHRNNPISQACLPWHFTYVVFVFGEFRVASSVTIRINSNSVTAADNCFCNFINHFRHVFQLSQYVLVCQNCEQNVSQSCWDRKVENKEPRQRSLTRLRMYLSTVVRYTLEAV